MSGARGVPRRDRRAAVSGIGLGICSVAAREFDDGRQRGERRVRDRIGGAIEPRVEIGDVVRLMQPEVPLRQRDPRIARQMAEPADRPGQRAAQQLRMALGADAVREHAVKRQAGPEMREPERERAERLRHRLRGDHRGDGHAERLREIGARRRAVEEPHRAFDQDHVRLGRGAREQRAAAALADHSEIERIDARAARAREQHRIEKIRAGLEHAHAPAEPPVMARERRRHRRLALAGRGGGDEERGAGGHRVRTPRRAAPSRLAPCTDA